VLILNMNFASLMSSFFEIEMLKLAHYNE